MTTANSPSVPMPQAPTPARVRFAVLGLYAVAALLFNYIYATYTAYSWSYMGLDYRLDLVRLSAGMACLAIVVLLLPIRRTPQSFFLHCLALLYIMPAASIFAYNNTFPVMGLVIIMAATAIVYVVSSIPFSLLVSRTVSLRAYAFGTIGATGLLILVVIALGGLRTFNLDLNQVYNLRDEAGENLPPIFGYIIPIFTKAVIPFGIAAALHYRLRNFAIMLVLASLILFGITSHKIVIFAPVVVTLTYLAISRVSPIITLVGGTASILFMIAVMVVLNPNMPTNSLGGWIESMLMWRSLIVPAFLDFQYIRFFADNPSFFWSTSQITFGLIESPYNGMGMARLIGVAVFSDSTLEANTGFIGSGYGQAGLLGVLLYSAGVGFVLSIADSAAKALAPEFVIAAMLTLVLTMFMSTDFVGMFLTHGLLVAILLLLTLKPAEATGPAALASLRRSYS